MAKRPIDRVMSIVALAIVLSTISLIYLTAALLVVWIAGQFGHPFSLWATAAVLLVLFTTATRWLRKRRGEEVPSFPTVAKTVWSFCEGKKS